MKITKCKINRLIERIVNHKLKRIIKETPNKLPGPLSIPQMVRGMKNKLYSTEGEKAVQGLLKSFNDFYKDVSNFSSLNIWITRVQSLEKENKLYN